MVPALSAPPTSAWGQRKEEDDGPLLVLMQSLQNLRMQIEDERLARRQLELRVQALEGSNGAQKDVESNKPQQDEDMLEYTLGDTLWDVPAFMGLPGLGGHYAWKFMMAGCLLNAFVQSYMAWILMNSRLFVQKRLWKVMAMDMHRWRDVEAHDASMLDSMGTNLVSRVCGQDAALSVASSQAQIIGEINSYLSLGVDQLSMYEVGQGPMLCGVCVFLFTMEVLKDMRGLLISITAFASLPRGHTRLEGNRLVAISSTRLLALASMHFVRASVGMALLYVGVMWLSFTSSVTELVLNAAALAFILNVDELLYETLLPSSAQKRVAALKPIAYRRLPFHLEACLPFCMVLVVVSGCVLGVVLPNTRDMLQVKLAVCGDHTNFALAKNEAGMMVSKSTRHFDMSVPTGIRLSAVKELRGLQPGSAPKYSLAARSWQDFFQDSRTTVLQLAQQTYCADLDTFNEGVAADIPIFFLSIREETFLHRGKSISEVPFRCRDYHAYCGNTSLMRTTCPITCGCANPRSSLLLRQPSAGCPPLCAEVAQKEMAAMARCEDIDSSNGANWTAFWRSYERLWSSRIEFIDWRSFADGAIAGGCNASLLDPLGGHDFCDETAPLMASLGVGSIAGFCPSRCCSLDRAQGPMPGLCPKSCQALPGASY